MNVTATVLSENSVFSNLGAVAEHGWAVYLETDHGNYLFDTGQGKALRNNATVLKKDLSECRGIILSHHHVDHTGGLFDAVQMVKRKPVDVFAHPDLFKRSYLARKEYKYIGIPFRKDELEDSGAKFRFNTEFSEIAPGLFLSGEVPRVTDFEYGDEDIVLESGDGYVRDPVPDDQTVIIRTEKGLFIILGCSHAGLINILLHAVKKTGDERIHTVIGGTHLWPVGDEQKKKTIQALKDFHIKHLGVSHCTGLSVGMELAREFGERFFYCSVGTTISVP